MSNEREYLYIVAMEECGELIQNISKCIRFGEYNHHPNREQSNAFELLTEYYQLQAVIEMLIKGGVFDDILEHFGNEKIEEIKRLKQINVNKFMWRYQPSFYSVYCPDACGSGCTQCFDKEE